MYFIRYYDLEERTINRAYCFRRRALKKLSELIGNERYEVTTFSKLWLTYKEVLPAFIRCFTKQTIVYEY